MLGSVIPSSRYLIRQLLRDVQWDRIRVIVEFGPGVGTISREILERMRPDATSFPRVCSTAANSGLPV